MLIPILIAVLGIWLAVLTVLFYLLLSHYNRLAGKTKAGDLKKVLDEILKVCDGSKKEIAFLTKETQRLEAEAGFHIQKVGLFKYNPFNETGGDHSFSLALLDRHGSGIIITGLHTREKTRIYVKSIKEGETAKNLSEEEKRALVEASRK